MVAQIRNVLFKRKVLLSDFFSLADSLTEFGEFLIELRSLFGKCACCCPLFIYFGNNGVVSG